MSALHSYFEKLLKIIRARTPVAGIEISDSSLRLAYPEGSSFRFAGVRLEPGILERGAIKDRARFLEALRSLRSQVVGTFYGRRHVPVVAAASSVDIYSQVFSLPIIEGENLEKAIQLNVQMVSPIDVAKSYASWQIVAQDPYAVKIEVLASFIDRWLADDFTKAFFEVGFVLVVLESRALSLARLIREQAADIDPGKSYIVFHPDDLGIDFLIVRHGQSYFEYSNPWEGVRNTSGEISAELFQAEITRGLYQILNFYGQHWPEPLSEVLVSSTAFSAEFESLIKKNFSLPPRVLRLRGSEGIEPEWFVPLSCGIRGSRPRQDDREISLLGIGAQEVFWRDQLVGFTSFWRLMMPFTLGLIAVLLMGTDFALSRFQATGSSSLSNVGDLQTTEAQHLQAEVKDFNQSVQFIHAVESSAFTKSTIIEKLNAFATNSIVISRIVIQGSSDPITVTGVALSEATLTAFKDAIQNDASFQNVTLPLSSLVPGANGISFSMTLQTR